MATDTSGNPISKQTYFAFGAVRTSEGTSPTDYGFTGQRYDASSALMYYGARYYNPVLGRFIQADPILADAWNPQALNRYAYVYNNPVRYTDPTGHCVPELFTCGPHGDPEKGGPPPEPPPARDEDPSKYGEPPEPEVPPAPAEECHRACKDDSGPSQPKAPESEETPTPAASSTFGCPFGKFCHDPDSVYSYGLTAGAVHWVGGGGLDIVADWDTNQIGLFTWGIHPFPALLTPQIGSAWQKGEIWGMDKLSDYQGDFDVTGASVKVFSANYIQSTNQKIQGVEAGFDIGLPPVELHYYKTHADYPPVQTWTLPDWLTPVIRRVFQ